MADPGSLLGPGGEHPAWFFVPGAKRKTSPDGVPVPPPPGGSTGGSVGAAPPGSRRPKNEGLFDGLMPSGGGGGRGRGGGLRSMPLEPERHAHIDVWPSTAEVRFVRDGGVRRAQPSLKDPVSSHPQPLSAQQRRLPPRDST